MFGIRDKLCFEISRRLIKPPDARTTDTAAYDDWRSDALTQSWAQFDDAAVAGKDVIDFGCGAGNLTFFLAHEKAPRRIVAVDLDAPAIARASERSRTMTFPKGTTVEFKVGAPEGLPLPNGSFDTLLAFDCLEHVMEPAPMLADWARVLKPGGRALIVWFPFRGPWGPHMESLVPIPWAHVLFGERAMFRTAEQIYDLPTFAPRPWDLDENGHRRPNKWRQWSSFKEQGYVNELDLDGFRGLADGAGFDITRFETHAFSSSSSKKLIGAALMKLPALGEYFTSHVIAELTRR